MQTRFEQKISSLKKQHKCELQKSLIQHGATEDSSIFRFEEEITDLKMKLKKKDQI